MGEFDGVSYNDDGWRKLLAQVEGLDRWTVHVGILVSKGGEEVDPGEDGDGDLTLLELAAIHEFGLGLVPERSFIRRTFREKQGELRAICEKLCKAVITRNMPVPRAYALLGQWGAAAVKRTITEGEGVPPALAQATIDRKGSDRPLVDTGRLINAITYEVVEDATDGSDDVGFEGL